MKRIILATIVFLTILKCSTTQHKESNVVDLREIINRVEMDEAIPQDKKNYIASELKNAQRELNSKSQTIADLQKENNEQDKTIQDLQKKVEKLSEAKGRINQIDYQFWGLIGIILLFVIIFILWIILKFGNAVGKVANPQGIAIDAFKKAAGL